MATSFFEKLKKGMGVEAPVKEEDEETPKVIQREKKLPKNAEEATPRVMKKIEIKTEEKILELPKLEESEKKEVEVKKTEETQRKPPKEKTDLESPAPLIKISEDKVAEGKEKWLQPEGELAVDVYQTEEEIVIQSTIAGIIPENLDISVENDVVTIRGSRERPGEASQRDYFYQECYWGSIFQRNHFTRRNRSFKNRSNNERRSFNHQNS